MRNKKLNCVLLAFLVE